MQMDEGLDTGAMLTVERIPIAPDDTSASLFAKLAPLGGQMIAHALQLAERHELTPCAQPLEGVTYAKKIDKAEAAIDWHADAASIERRLRAFDPFPGATTTLDGATTIKCWRGVLEEGTGKPGEVIASSDAGITIVCGRGALRLTALQRAGGKRMTAAQFLQSQPLGIGQTFASAPSH
jgi:methionyl-tRNA formyltransferase